MSDPLRGIFGTSARELFAGRRFVVSHGPLERLPPFLRSGPMSSIDALCQKYVGPLEVAQGSAGEGIQVPVSDVHPVALLRLGLTVYFSDLRRTLPESRAWLRALEASLGLVECATLSAFTNAPGSGLSVHHDRFDQLLIQIEGRKHFRYAPNGFVENPDIQFSPYAPSLPEFGQTYRHGFPPSGDALAVDRFETLVLEPGSALFMPAGTWHTTAEQSERALSVIVAVRAPSRLDLALNLLRYYASQSPEWRARPYGGFSSDPADTTPEHEMLARLLGDLGGRLGALAPRQAFDAWKAHVFLAGALAEFPRNTALERYIRVPNATLGIDERPEGKLGCVILAGPTDRPPARTELALNREARAILDWLLATHRAFTLDEAARRFPEFTREDLVDLLGWLTQAGLVRPLPAPEWDAT